MSTKRIVYRSAESGEFVTREFAEANPSTTVAETVEIFSELHIVPEYIGTEAEGSDGSDDNARYGVFIGTQKLGTIHECVNEGFYINYLAKTEEVQETYEDFSSALLFFYDLISKPAPEG